jgi:hypothetical protein
MHSRTNARINVRSLFSTALFAAPLAVVALAFASGCGGASPEGDPSPTVSSTGPTGSASNDTASPGTSAAAFEGTFQATWSGTALVNGESIPSDPLTGTITVTASGDAGVHMDWVVDGNQPSGSITFAVQGSAATATGIATGGVCWMGVLPNGNHQTTCAMTATAQIDGTTLTQHQAGTIDGVTPENVPYSGTYDGTWVGTRTP